MADEMANTNTEPTSRTFESTAAGTAGSSQADQTSGGAPATEAPHPIGETSSAPAASGEGSQAPAETTAESGSAGLASQCGRHRNRRVQPTTE
jgi:hypothetical protein